MSTVPDPSGRWYWGSGDGDVPDSTHVSVGDVVDTGLVLNVVGAVVLLVGTWLTAPAIVIVTAIRRSRARALAEPTQRTFALV